MSLVKIGELRTPALTRNERQRLVNVMRWARGEGWANVGLLGSAGGSGYWHNKRLGLIVDYAVEPDGSVYVSVGNERTAKHIGSGRVSSVGQAIDVLAALRIVPGRFSGLFVAGAMTVAERLVEAVRL